MNPYTVIEHGCHAEVRGPEISELFQDRNKARLLAAHLNVAFAAGEVRAFGEAKEIAIDNLSPSHEMPIEET